MNIGNGTSSINGVFYHGNEYLLYYQNNSIMGLIASKNSVRSFNITGNFTGIRGNIALSINFYGNLWISYVSSNNNTYFLKVANITLNGTYKHYREYTIITSPDPIMQTTVLVSESGFNNTFLIT